jgi:hypothetical protein
MPITSKLKRHKIMERTMRALMGDNLPPRFKFKDTYDSIEVPAAYQQHLPTQAEIEAKFEELEVQEEAVENVAIDATVIAKTDSVITSNLEVGTSNLFVDTETGRVGIGAITGMTEKLSVNGNIDLTPVYGDQGDTNKSGMIIFNKTVGGSIDTTTNIDSIYYDDSQNAYHFTKDTTKYATGNARLVCGTLTTGVITRTAYNPGEVIETLHGRADGSSITVLSGTYTLTNVTAAQDIGTGHTVINGSSISYKPPPGTTRVIYELQVYTRHKDADVILHFAGRLAGTQVSHTRHTLRSRDYEQQWVYNNMTITIGEVASDNLAAGQLASWTTNKTIDFTARDYNASYEGYLHRTDHWNGAGTDLTVTPVIKITAIA